MLWGGRRQALRTGAHLARRGSLQPTANQRSDARSIASAAQTNPDRVLLYNRACPHRATTSATNANGDAVACMLTVLQTGLHNDNSALCAACPPSPWCAPAAGPNRGMWDEELRAKGLAVLDASEATPAEEALAEVTFAVVWDPPPGLLAKCPRLQAVQSTGAGVDGILQPDCMPDGVPLARIVRFAPAWLQSHSVPAGTSFSLVCFILQPDSASAPFSLLIRPLARCRKHCSFAVYFWCEHLRRERYGLFWPIQANTRRANF